MISNEWSGRKRSDLIINSTPFGGSALVLYRVEVEGGEEGEGEGAGEGEGRGCQ